MSIKLCIDPGHGMGNIVSGRFDPGASGGGLTEADIVLQWALTGKWVADQLGIAVFLTRDDDRDEDPVS
jgi:N-acetylmuramoyl-L-alanine amidase